LPVWRSGIVQHPLYWGRWHSWWTLWWWAKDDKFRGVCPWPSHFPVNDVCICN
jgi:hypothetical protein